MYGRPGSWPPFHSSTSAHSQTLTDHFEMCAGEWRYVIHYEKFPPPAERFGHLQPVPVGAKFSRDRSYSKKKKTGAHRQGEESEEAREQWERAHEDA